MINRAGNSAHKNIIMANWCFNTVTFNGEADEIEKLKDLFYNMQAQFILHDKGQLPSFIHQNSDHFFDMNIAGNVLTYNTKWTPNLETMVQIADYFGVGFVFHYEETANGVFGEAVYQDCILRDVFLEIADFARYTYDEEKEVYWFEGKSYEDNTEILEILLERRKLN
jgi:hypothetical protein